MKAVVPVSYTHLVMDNAATYFWLTALSYPFLALYNSCAALFRSMGNSRVSMMASMIMNGINVEMCIRDRAYVGNNCVIKNSIILNDVYIGDNTVIENCIVESRDTIRANTTYIGTPDEIKIVVEKNERYTL